MSSTIPAHVDLRESDKRKGRRLEYFTLGWNLTEAVVGIGAGVIAGSIALIGFGVDSIFESLSGATLLWRLQSHEAGEKREQLALKLVGISFFVLAAYVAIDAAKTLVQREPPHASIVGVCLAAVSIVVMPLLAREKRRVAARLNSRALVADSRQTDLCAYLSGILFVGLALNALFGWWWADSIAAILMVPIITREGIEALKGDACDELPLVQCTLTKIRPRKDKRGVDLISDALPFGRLWYDGPHAATNAIGYAEAIQPRA